MGGPWFTVQESGGGFQQLATLLISNGSSHERASVEYRVTLTTEHPR